MQHFPQLFDREEQLEIDFVRANSRGDSVAGFYAKVGKRMLDTISAGVGLLLLLPLFTLVILCLKATSRGPVFYRQTRVGKDGRKFQIVKFRSMEHLASNLPPGITVFGDKRVTPLGKILRRYKIDELPELWNVLLGEMSLVGPRPELPKYVESYSLDQRAVLKVRPGITDPSSLVYRHEEVILENRENPEQFYREQILPDKLARSLQYIEGVSFGGDLQIIFKTILSSFLPSLTRLLRESIGDTPSVQGKRRSRGHPRGRTTALANPK